MISHGGSQNIVLVINITSHPSCSGESSCSSKMLRPPREMLLRWAFIQKPKILLTSPSPIRSNWFDRMTITNYSSAHRKRVPFFIPPTTFCLLLRLPLSVLLLLPPAPLDAPQITCYPLAVAVSHPFRISIFDGRLPINRIRRCINRLSLGGDRPIIASSSSMSRIANAN